jgi:hypothetical protein
MHQTKSSWIQNGYDRGDSKSTGGGHRITQISRNYRYWPKQFGSGQLSRTTISPTDGVVGQSTVVGASETFTSRASGRAGTSSARNHLKARLPRG